MRVSVPGIPKAILNAKPAFSIRNVNQATRRLVQFVEAGNVAVLTGAGVSVDSGIRAYRGKDGRYMNPNYHPIFYHELMDATHKGYAYRQRYWLRSYLGYPPVRDARPNTTHYAVATLQYTSHVSHVITQNVDGLHHKALRQSPLPHTLSSRMQDSIMELHGTLHRVHCSKGHISDRDTFQDRLSAANPRWHEYAKELESTRTQPRTNPDGDVAIEHLGLSYKDFVIPDCPTCMLEGNQNSVHKPDLIFFGESIPESVKDQSYQVIEECDRLLLMGTTLATYSAFRLVRYALELGKPIILLNLGPTRADGLSGVEKLDIATRAVMRQVVRTVADRQSKEDPVVINMLQSGIDQLPSPDDDRHPRAAG